MADKNIEKSYYTELKEFNDKNQGELYSFQDFEKAGQMEYKVFTGKIKPLKLFKRNKMAVRLVKTLLEAIKNQNNYKKIEEYLKSNQVIYYYENIRETLSAVIENDIEKREILERFVKDVILNSRNEEMIKLSLIMAQVLGVENLDEILDVFSIHNSFIFYVINDYSHMEGKNHKIFEITKHSMSYGKLFALANLKISTNEIECWLVENGCIDNYGIPEITEYSILSVNLLDYLNKINFDNSDIEIFAKSFSVMLSDYGLHELDDKIEVFNKILEIIDDIGGGIYCLYTVISILYSVDGIIIDYYKEKKNIETLNNYSEYKKIIELCTDICNEPYWNEVIESEINNIEVEPDVIITCIDKTGYKIKKKEYESLLKRNYFSPLLYKYALAVGSKAIRKTAFKLGIANLPIDDMTTGSDELMIGNITYEEIYYVCFYILIKFSEIEDFTDDINEYKNINLRGLQCPMIEIRDECINNLTEIKDLINDSDRELIYNLLGKESNTRIRRGLRSLLEKDIYGNKNKQLMIQHPETIQIHPRDAFLSRAHILGEEEYNRTKVQSTLKENNVVYIMRNPYDDDRYSTVVCTANGYIIGYVEKPLDDILGNLIRADRYVYGMIKRISDDLSDITMSVYLSYKDVEDGVSDILALLSKTKEEYIQ